MKSIEYDKKVYVELRKRVRKHLREHKDMTLNPHRDNEHFMKNCASLGGRCPCSDTRPQCPCPESVDEVRKNGQCLCGLFVRRESDESN